MAWPPPIPMPWPPKPPRNAIALVVMVAEPIAKTAATARIFLRMGYSPVDLEIIRMEVLILPDRYRMFKLRMS
jgi:hypothetical protein